MVSQLIARVLSVTLFVIGLGCLAQAALFSTSHAPTTGSAAPSNIWATTSSLTAGSSLASNFTFVSKWVNGTNPSPGGNTHVTFTLKGANAFLLSGMYFGGAQTLASQCSGTLRAWSFASTPIQVLSQQSIGTAGFTTSQISIPSWPGTPFIISIDSASGQVGPSLATPNGTNTTPAGVASDFLMYQKSGVAEAATQCKGASYSTPTNQIRAVIGITSFP